MGLLYLYTQMLAFTAGVACMTVWLLHCMGNSFVPVPVAARSKAWVCCRSPAEIVGSNPAGGIVFVSCECCVLLCEDLCDEMIIRPEESYRLWCVVVCDLETL